MNPFRSNNQIRHIPAFLTDVRGDLRMGYRPLLISAGAVMNRISDFLAAGSCGINVELIDEVVSVDQVLENVLRHGAAADVAVANK